MPQRLAMAETRTILHVDDEVDLQELVVSYLQPEGFRLLTASDGAGMW